jgi:hypothetical protein
VLQLRLFGQGRRFQDTDRLDEDVVVSVAAPDEGDVAPVRGEGRLSGDATEGGEVGVNVTTYGVLEMTVLPYTNLAGVLTAGSYFGIGRVLKKNGRLDFGFNDDGTICRMPVSSDGPPPILDSAVCQHHLILQHGLYDRKADLVVFEGPPDATALLYDYQQDLNENGFLDPIRTGYAILYVEFE